MLILPHPNTHKLTRRLILIPVSSLFAGEAVGPHGPGGFRREGVTRRCADLQSGARSVEWPRGGAAEPRQRSGP